MKAIWKVLLGAAAVAAVAPYQVKKDEETGAVTLKAATWAGTYTKDGTGKNFTLKLLPGIIRDAGCECEDECCSEDECCGEENEDEGGITIELDVRKDEEEPKAEAEVQAEPEPEPKPEEA